MGRRDPRPLKRLRLTGNHYESMRAHVDSCLPLEGCGLLAGKGNLVREVIPVPNQARSAVRFSMDPREQLRAFNWMDDRGLVLVGIFHSHPAGPDRPSPTDVAEASYRVVQVIWWRDPRQWKVRGYWIEEGRSLEVELYAAGGNPAC